jgi:pimeloyl-ACP methyl ester carboxylesterase
MRQPIRVPVLHLQGAKDGLIRADRARTTPALAGSAYRFGILPEAGHYPSEETPSHVNEILLRWLTKVAG